MCPACFCDDIEMQNLTPLMLPQPLFHQIAKQTVHFFNHCDSKNWPVILRPIKLWQQPLTGNIQNSKPELYTSIDSHFLPLLRLDFGFVFALGFFMGFGSAFEARKGTDEASGWCPTAPELEEVENRVRSFSN